MAPSLRARTNILHFTGPLAFLNDKIVSTVFMWSFGPVNLLLIDSGREGLPSYFYLRSFWTMPAGGSTLLAFWFSFAPKVGFPNNFRRVVEGVEEVS
ncbi:hypothetical protein TSUD_215120 [Trifolium subterraneum]|uniref:Uncharacterized protein n=1 Tax=Trifolium subterraneum TaxID=3900 RepID=A0A2Z6MJ26_TRISU|nr:hypothetical protein TSUD_215120 [Trifolium subterraneum]